MIIFSLIVTETGDDCIISCPSYFLYLIPLITDFPASLLLLRQALDFTYKEELLMNTLSDYVEHVRTWVEEVPAEKKPNEAAKEEIIDHIAESIRQTAAAAGMRRECAQPGRLCL